MLVYLIYCSASQKGYVGQTTQTLKRRWQKHCADAQTGSDYLIHKAIRKYGEDAFEISVLAEVDNLPDLDQIEIEQIEKQGTLAPNGYNIKQGGHHPEFPDEIRKKISAAKIGRKLPPFTVEHRKKMSNSKIGCKHSEETRRKMCASQKARQQKRLEVF
jgi:group I intron endonuclease